MLNHDIESQDMSTSIHDDAWLSTPQVVGEDPQFSSQKDSLVPEGFVRRLSMFNMNKANFSPPSAHNVHPLIDTPTKHARAVRKFFPYDHYTQPYTAR